MIETGSTFLGIVGPKYGFFGLGNCSISPHRTRGGWSGYFAGGFLRTGIGLLGGWIAPQLKGSATAVFAAIAFAMVAYGRIMLAAIRAGAWFR